MNLRNHIKQHRARLDLTQQDLAERVGVRRQTILAIEKGHYVPPDGYVRVSYKVKKGDTLGAIAKHYYGNAKRYTDIYEANKGTLASPDANDATKAPPGEGDAGEVPVKVSAPGAVSSWM